MYQTTGYGETFCRRSRRETGEVPENLSKSGGWYLRSSYSHRGELSSLGEWQPDLRNLAFDIIIWTSAIMSGEPSAPSTRPSSVYSLSFAQVNNGGNGKPPYPHVDVLLLGSGWTSAWLLPELFSQDITFAYTNRTGTKPPWLALPGHHPVKWTCPGAGESRIQWRRSFKDLPVARLVVVVMALNDDVAAKELISSYHAYVHEKSAGAAERPKFCILSSTGAYGKGRHTSADRPPISGASPRYIAESALLSTFKRDIVVLSLAGLYGGSTRHPLNWLSKVAGDEEKLGTKGSLHLVHGKDVTQAVLGVWHQLEHSGRNDKSSVWGQRWIVTDGRVYDWWQLALELPPQDSEDRSKYAKWVNKLKSQHGVKHLPRPVGSAEQGPPQYLDRELSSDSFWEVIGKKPSVGPATQVDVPVSPTTGAPVATSSVASSSASTTVVADGASKALRWTPTIHKARLQDLIGSLQHEIGREAAFPLPSVFEGRKERFGLTHQRFLALRKGWLDYLTSSGHTQPSWASHWKELLTYDHFYYPIPDKLSGAFVQGTLDGLHFVRVQPSQETRAQGRRIEPLLFLHGWPGSFLEGLFVARALANPGPDTPLSKPAFDVVVPSMPGYAWSGSPVVDDEEGTSVFTGPEGDLLPFDVAGLVNELMLDLFPSLDGNPKRYSITAGDWGAGVARRCSVRFPNNVKVTHLNFIPAPPPPLAPTLVPNKIMDAASTYLPGFATLKNLPRKLGQEHFLPRSPSSSSVDSQESQTQSSLGNRLQLLLGLPAPLNEADAQRVQRGLEFQNTGSAYAQFHGTRPSTLGNICHSSPSALLSWIGEKFLAWSDPRRPLADSLIFESLTLWWCTETMVRALYPYRNRDVKEGPMTAVGRPENFIHVPTGYSMAPYELIPSPLAWSKGTANIVWHREHEKGGHFLASERPDKYVADVRDFVQFVLDGGRD